MHPITAPASLIFADADADAVVASPPLPPATQVENARQDPPGQVPGSTA
jgi:hypothetical protein